MGASVSATFSFWTADESQRCEESLKCQKLCSEFLVKYLFYGVPVRKAKKSADPRSPLWLEVHPDILTPLLGKTSSSESTFDEQLVRSLPTGAVIDGKGNIKVVFTLFTTEEITYEMTVQDVINIEQAQQFRDLGRFKSYSVPQPYSNNFSKRHEVDLYHVAPRPLPPSVLKCTHDSITLSWQLSIPQPIGIVQQVEIQYSLVSTGATSVPLGSTHAISSIASRTQKRRFILEHIEQQLHLQTSQELKQRGDIELQIQRYKAEKTEEDRQREADRARLSKLLKETPARRRASDYVDGDDNDGKRAIDHAKAPPTSSSSSSSRLDEKDQGEVGRKSHSPVLVSERRDDALLRADRATRGSNDNDNGNGNDNGNDRATRGSNDNDNDNGNGNDNGNDRATRGSNDNGNDNGNDNDPTPSPRGSSSSSSNSNSPRPSFVTSSAAEPLEAPTPFQWHSLATRSYEMPGFFSYTFDRLLPGQGYVFRLRYRNHLSFSPYSVPTPLVCTRASPPSVPDSPILGSVTASSIMLFWQPPSRDNGSAITCYELRARSVGGEWVVLYSGNGLSFVASELYPDFAYSFQVAACNSQGRSDFSEPLSTQTPPRTRMEKSLLDGSLLSNPAALALFDIRNPLSPQFFAASRCALAWRELWDPGSENVFYFNRITSVRQLDRPQCLGPEGDANGDSTGGDAGGVGAGIPLTSEERVRRQEVVFRKKRYQLLRALHKQSKSTASATASASASASFSRGGGGATESSTSPTSNSNSQSSSSSSSPSKTASSLLVTLDRCCMLSDAYRSLAPPAIPVKSAELLSKRLRFAFVGEEGIDSGGIGKEAFLLLSRSCGRYLGAHYRCLLREVYDCFAPRSGPNGEGQHKSSGTPGPVPLSQSSSLGRIFKGSAKSSSAKGSGKGSNKLCLGSSTDRDADPESALLEEEEEEKRYVDAVATEHANATQDTADGAGGLFLHEGKEGNVTLRNDALARRLRGGATAADPRHPAPLHAAHAATSSPSLAASELLLAGESDVVSISPATLKVLDVVPADALMFFFGRLLGKAVVDRQLVDVRLSGLLLGHMVGIASTPPVWQTGNTSPAAAAVQVAVSPSKSKAAVTAAVTAQQAGSNSNNSNSRSSNNNNSSNNNTNKSETPHSNANAADEDNAAATNLALLQVRQLDPELHRSLQWMQHNDITGVLDQTFSVTVNDPGGLQRELALCPSGQSRAVTEQNKAEYVYLLAQWKSRFAVLPLLEPFLKGFHELVPSETLRAAGITPLELGLLLSGKESVEADDLRPYVIYQSLSLSELDVAAGVAPFGEHHEQVLWFWQCCRELTQTQLRSLLRFFTGSSRIPLDGFDPPLTLTQGADMVTDSLPRAHTCFNQLVLPQYSKMQSMKERLVFAAENSASFDLS